MALQTISNATGPVAQTLFNLNTGIINEKFQRQLDIVGIAVKQHFSEFATNYIKNVNEELQTNGCFQKYPDFYKKGGISSFKISYEQAVKFLDDDYRDREILMPREKKLANAVFPCGVEATMHKRFNSLIKSIKAGYQYDKLHFIVKDEDDKNNVLKLMDTSDKQDEKDENNVLKPKDTSYNQFIEDEKDKNILDGVSVNVVVAHTELDIFEKGLQQLKEEGALSKEYVIITDPTFASKVEMIASKILDNHSCLGVASVPIDDWKKDMNLYGYEEALGSYEKAAIAWALSAWNFKARQVHTELKAFESKVVVL